MINFDKTELTDELGNTILHEWEILIKEFKNIQMRILNIQTIVVNINERKYKLMRNFVIEINA